MPICPGGARLFSSRAAGRRNTRSRSLTLGALALGAMVSGCIAYGPQQLSAMSAYDLCEAQLYSRINLTKATQAQIGEEIARRREDCSRQVASIEADRDVEVHRAMYENSGP